MEKHSRAGPQERIWNDLHLSRPFTIFLLFSVSCKERVAAVEKANKGVKSGEFRVKNLTGIR